VKPATGAIYLVGAVTVLAAIGLVAVFSRPPPAPEPEPEPEPVPPAPDTRDARRQRVLAAARAELGHVGGDRYFAAVAPGLVGSKADWCGVFALAMLHEAGLALDREWVIEKGFILVGPHPLHTTTDPKPGDLIYIDQPFQHEGIVERVEGDTIHTLDGNTRNTVAAHERPRSSITAFYSIEPLLAEVGLVA
jgi:hypothetical protein